MKTKGRYIREEEDQNTTEEKDLPITSEGLADAIEDVPSEDKLKITFTKAEAQKVVDILTKRIDDASDDEEDDSSDDDADDEDDDTSEDDKDLNESIYYKVCESLKPKTWKERKAQFVEDYRKYTRREVVDTIKMCMAWSGYHEGYDDLQFTVVEEGSGANYKAYTGLEYQRLELTGSDDPRSVDKARDMLMDRGYIATWPEVTGDLTMEMTVYFKVQQ